MLQLLALLLLCYLLGSIPTSIIMGKLLRGIDIREHGSGNAGGTNVFRVLGWRPAMVVAGIDIAKGWLPTAFFATWLLPITPPPGDLAMVQIMAGFAAVLGHTYTIFAGFRGGKGVGTLAGVLLALFPILFPLCLLVFVAVLVCTGYVSLSSMVAAACLPIFLLGLPLMVGLAPAPVSLVVFSFLAPAFIFFTHRANITRLLAGTENRFERVRLFKKS